MGGLLLEYGCVFRFVAITAVNAVLYLFCFASADCPH